MSLTIPARDLRPGDRFLTPGGRELTVHSSRSNALGAYGSVEIRTVEPYLPGERMVADGAFPLALVARADKEARRG